jgi:hypothetical protein
MAPLRAQPGSIAEKLDRLGITLVLYPDPVDGTPTPCLESQQVAYLVTHYENALREAVETRPIRIEIKTTEQQNRLIELAVLEERKRVLEILGGPHPANSGLDSATLAEMIARVGGA